MNFVFPFLRPLHALVAGASLLSSLPAQAQQHLWTDTWNGGFVVGTFSVGDQSSGIGALFMQLPPGATVRRAVLYATHVGGQPSDSYSITLGSIPVTFNAGTAGPSYNSLYGTVTLHSVDLTAVLDPTIGVYTLDASQGFSDFKEYMLMTEYELAGAGPVTVDIYHCNQDAQLQETYAVHTTYPMNTAQPVAFGTMAGYMLSPFIDYESVTVNGMFLGKIYGRDSNAAAGNLFGACATFHYANGLFAGVGDDNADQAINGADALSNLVGLVPDSAQDFQVVYAHNPTMLPAQQQDNLVNMMVVCYSALECVPVSLGPDTLLCPGEQLVLDATMSGAQYLWQDGSTAPTFTVSGPGTYAVQWQHPNCTFDPDTVVVDYVQHPATGVTGSRDLCTGSNVALGLSPLPGAQYLWADGSMDMPRTVDSAGVYTLHTTIGRCDFLDSVSVAVVNCETRVELPNVFTPNGNGSNDNFRPIELTGVQQLRFSVYNRWGRLLFSTTRPELNWDGRTDNGEPVPAGVYFWVMEYTSEHAPEAMRSLHGTVTLLR
jgi:gliding motility-associated-like protein